MTNGLLHFVDLSCTVISVIVPHEVSCCRRSEYLEELPTFTGIALAIPAFFLKLDLKKLRRLDVLARSGGLYPLSLSSSHSHTFASSQSSSDIVQTV